MGAIITGKVTSITKFGAFVALPDGKSGLVHISEVAGTFVSDVHDFLTQGQEVPVKVLSISPEGKISLSVKQAQPPKPRPPHGDRPARPRGPRPAPARSVPAQPAAPAELSFEDKLKQFMSVSDSKQSELNRYMASKRGGRRRQIIPSKTCRGPQPAAGFFDPKTGAMPQRRTALSVPRRRIRLHFVYFDRKIAIRIQNSPSSDTPACIPGGGMV